MAEHIYFPVKYHPIRAGPFVVTFLYHPSTMLIFLVVTRANRSSQLSLFLFGHLRVILFLAELLTDLLLVLHICNSVSDKCTNAFEKCPCVTKEWLLPHISVTLGKASFVFISYLCEGIHKGLWKDYSTYFELQMKTVRPNLQSIWMPRNTYGCVTTLEAFWHFCSVTPTHSVHRGRTLWSRFQLWGSINPALCGSLLLLLCPHAHKWVKT